MEEKLSEEELKEQKRQKRLLYARQYYQLHKEEHIKKCVEYARKNKDRFRDYKNDYYKKYYLIPENREKRRLYNKKWVNKNRDKLREYGKMNYGRKKFRKFLQKKKERAIEKETYIQ